MKTKSFYEILTEAVRDISEHGFDSMDRLERWVDKIRRAAAESLTPPHMLEAALNAALRDIYAKALSPARINKTHAGVSRFTVERLKPKLRVELDRRIMASANLIKLNRAASIDRTIQRFSGWATSIPAGGSKVVAKNPVKSDIRKSLAQLPFEERRVIIDQGHKFNSSLSNIIAVDGGAIAAIWHSHWREAGYNYRPNHKKLDGQVFALRGSWAIEKGLMNKGDGYTDEVEMPAEPPFCRCYYEYLYNIRDLPDRMITEKGRKALLEARKSSL